MATTTDDVREALDGLSTASFDSHVYDDGIQVSFDESDAGAFFKAMRINDFDASTTRLGDSLVARIDAEDSNSLAELFG